MANFEGNVVPATVKRLRNHFDGDAELYNKYIPGTGMEEALAKADDIMDDGIINQSGNDLKETVKFIPFTSVTGTINSDTLDLSETEVGTITPGFLPANATNAAEVDYTYSSSNEEVATVAAGIVTAEGEGEAIITVGIVGTTLTKDFEITVVA